MEPADAEAVYAVSTAAFEDLERRLGRDCRSRRRPAPAPAHRVARRSVRTDPGGAWVAERDGEVVGGALAIMREGVWGLSLLVVRPDAQSSGAGRELLARAFAYGDGARGHIVLASRDPRALRAYARLGLALHPALAAARPRAGRRGAGGAARHRRRPAADRGGRPVRARRRPRRGHPGADRGRQPAARAARARLRAGPGRRGPAARGVRRGQRGDAAARLPRRRGRRRVGRSSSSPARQQWAVGPCLEAGLELRSEGGAVFVGGDVGPFAPYLPSGAYL